MFTKLKDQNADSKSETTSYKQPRNKKDKDNKADNDWVNSMSQTPIISKSMILPRYPQTKQQLIQQLLQLPYKGVMIQKESTCQQKQSRQDSGYSEEMPSYWYINQFLKTTNLRKERYKDDIKKYQKEVPTQNAIKQSQKYKEKYQVKDGQNKFNVLDYFMKNKDKEDSDIISQTIFEATTKYPREHLKQAFYQSKYSLPQTRRNQQRQVTQPFKDFKKQKQKIDDQKQPIISNITQKQKKINYLTSAVQTSFSNKPKSIQCSIIKQNEQGNQYSYQYQTDQDLNISQIKKSSLLSHEDSLSDKNSIRQIESSLEERKSIKPLVVRDKKKQQQSSEQLNKGQRRQNIFNGIQRQEQNIGISKKSNQTKDQTPAISKVDAPAKYKTEVQEIISQNQNELTKQKQKIQRMNQQQAKTNPKQQKHAKNEGQINNVLQIDLNKKVQQRNNQKNSQQKAKKNSHKQLTKEQKVVDQRPQSNQQQPVKKSVDLLEQKKKRQKLLKMQDDTNKKLFNIFQNTYKGASNSEQASAQQNQAIKSKLTQKQSSPSEEIKDQSPSIFRKQQSLKEPSPKNPQSKGNRSQVNISDMQSFHTADLSKRVFSDFMNYTSDNNQENSFSDQASDDLDSFENYESSQENGKQPYVLEQVKQEQNQESLAQSKVINFAKKQEKPKQTMHRMQIPFASKISEEKSFEPSVEHSIVQQYSFPQNSKNSQKSSNKQKHPRSEHEYKKPESNAVDNSFDLQQFIIKDIKNNVDELKSKMSKQVSSSSNKSVLNAFEQFNNQIKYSDLKKDIDGLKNKISITNNL